jgi:hypothetical protein
MPGQEAAPKDSKDSSNDSSNDSKSSNSGNNILIEQSTTVNEVIIIWYNEGAGAATSTVTDTVTVTAGAGTAAAAVATHQVSQLESQKCKKGY